MSRSTRRDFLAATFGAAALSRLGAQPQKRLATDWITLGKSNVKVTRLALGTGTFGGRVQRNLGQEEFTRLVRHAYDRGIRFFETAESYHGHARDARHRAQGTAARELRADDQVQHAGNGRPRSRKSTASAASSKPSTSTSCCCTACVRRPGRTTIAACRTGSRRPRARRSFSRTAPASTACPRCAPSPGTSGSISP